MPSCVVTGCRHNTTDQSRQEGVTFHRLPGDKTWRNSWITVIREWRNQPEWVPSKFSVLCSAHFDDNDMYYTKKGNRKIEYQKIPTIHLNRPTPAIEKRSKCKVKVKAANENYSRTVQSNTERSNDGNADNKMVIDDQLPSGCTGEEIQKDIINAASRREVGESEREANVLGENVIVKEESEEEMSTEIPIDPLAHQDNPGNFMNVVPDSTNNTKYEINAANEHYSQSVQSNTKRSNDGNAGNLMVTDDQVPSGYTDEEIQKDIINAVPRREVESGEIKTQTNVQGENIIIKEEPEGEISTEIPIDACAQQEHPGNLTNVVPDSTNYEQELEAVTAQLNESKHKTRILLEKLKRSEKRNLKMKNILKEIKFKKLIDRDVFRELTACLFENDDRYS